MTACMVDVFGFRIRVETGLTPAEQRTLFGRWRSRRPLPHEDLTVHFVRRVPRLSLAPGTGVAGTGFLLRLPDRTAWLVRPMGGTPSEMRRRWASAAIFMLHLLTEAGRLKKAKRSASPGRFVLGLHASSVAGPRGALVFCGQSGHGKSTIARRLLRDHPLIAEDWTTVLGGERGCKNPRRLDCCDVPHYVAKTFEEGGARACGDGRMPVAGLFWLEKSERFGLHPLSNAEAAARMLPPVQAGWSSATVQRRLRLLGRMLQARPCQRLEFRLERRGLVKLLSDAGYL